jgi:hypothetical protein
MLFNTRNRDASDENGEKQPFQASNRKSPIVDRTTPFRKLSLPYEADTQCDWIRVKLVIGCARCCRSATAPSPLSSRCNCRESAGALRMTRPTWSLFANAHRLPDCNATTSSLLCFTFAKPDIRIHRQTGWATHSLARLSPHGPARVLLESWSSSQRTAAWTLLV